MKHNKSNKKRIIALIITAVLIVGGCFGASAAIGALSPSPSPDWVEVENPALYALQEKLYSSTGSVTMTEPVELREWENLIVPPEASLNLGEWRLTNTDGQILNYGGITGEIIDTAAVDLTDYVVVNATGDNTPISIPAIRDGQGIVVKGELGKIWAAQSPGLQVPGIETPDETSEFRELSENFHLYFADETAVPGKAFQGANVLSVAGNLVDTGDPTKVEYWTKNSDGTYSVYRTSGMNGGIQYTAKDKGSYAFRDTKLSAVNLPKYNVSRKVELRYGEFVFTSPSLRSVYMPAVENLDIDTIKSDKVLTAYHLPLLKKICDSMWDRFPGVLKGTAAEDRIFLKARYVSAPSITDVRGYDAGALAYPELEQLYMPSLNMWHESTTSSRTYVAGGSYSSSKFVGNTFVQSKTQSASSLKSDRCVLGSDFSIDDETKVLIWRDTSAVWTFADRPDSMAVDFPDITRVGTYALSNANIIERINLPNVERIEHYAFSPYGKTTSPSLSLTPENLPKLTDLSQGAFSGNQQIYHINLPLITEMGSFVFVNNPKLATVQMDALKFIPPSTFSGSFNLFLGPQLRSFASAKGIGESAFASVGQFNVNASVFPAVEYVHKNAFKKALTTTVIFPSATSIGVSAFEASFSTSAYFPKIKTVGEKAFFGCTSLKILDIRTATGMGANAITEAPGLRALDLSSLTSFNVNTILGKVQLSGWRDPHYYVSGVSLIKLGKDIPAGLQEAVKNAPAEGAALSLHANRDNISSHFTHYYPNFLVPTDMLQAYKDACPAIANRFIPYTQAAQMVTLRAGADEMNLKEAAFPGVKIAKEETAFLPVSSVSNPIWAWTPTGDTSSLLWYKPAEDNVLPLAKAPWNYQYHYRVSSNKDELRNTAYWYPRLQNGVYPDRTLAFDKETYPNYTTAAFNGNYTMTLPYPGFEDFRREVLVSVQKQQNPNSLSAPIDIIKTPTSIEFIPQPGVEYSLGTPTAWTAAPNWSGLKEGTDYTFYARFAENDMYLASSPISFVVKTKIISAPPESINVLEVLDVKIIVEDIEGQEWSADGGLTWTNTGILDGLTPLTEYRLIARYAETNDRTQSEPCSPVTVKTKAAQLPPEAPTIREVTFNSISVETHPLNEYSIDNGANWQGGGIFANLLPQTKYTVIARKKATDILLPSPPSAGVTVKTKTENPNVPDIPTVITVTDSMIELSSEEGVEYSINGGNNWQTESIFDTLTPGTQYSISARYAGTDEISASAAVTISVRTLSAPGSIPSPVVERRTDTRIDLAYNSAAQYSINGGETWQDSSIFDNLIQYTYYSFVLRLRGDAMTMPSEPSESITVRTKMLPKTAPTTPLNVIDKSAFYFAVTVIEGAEYSLDNGITWQKSNVFGNLTAGTAHEAIYRMAETEDSMPSPASKPLIVVTKDIPATPNTPTLVGVTTTTIEIKPAASSLPQEFSIDDGDSWQKKTVFTGLAVYTEHEIIARAAETEDFVASEPSEPLKAQTGVDNAYLSSEPIPYLYGYPDDTIRPQGAVTREEVAEVIFRLLKNDVRANAYTTRNDFSDVSKNRWSNASISTLTNLKILEGYGSGTFRPRNSITRAEFVTILARMADATDVKPSNFTDVKGHWAAENIELAASEGWINGYADNTFKPDRKLTRAEAAAILNRVLGRTVSAETLPENQKTWKDNADKKAWYYLDVQVASNGK